MLKATLAAIAVSILAAHSPAQADVPDAVRSVQEDVNLRYSFRYEEPGRDYWRPVTRSGGDCEDFVLLKRQRLIEQGWATNDLAVLIISRRGTFEGRPSTEGHVVLYIRSLNLVLDSPAEGDRRKNLRPTSLEDFYRATGYEYFCVADNLTEGSMPASQRCAAGSRGRSAALHDQG